MVDQFGAGDTMRERVGASSWKLAVLVGADRWLLALALAGAVFASVVGVAVVHPVDSLALLRSGDPVETLFQAFVGAIVTGVTLVLTLNQLVLSQELGAVGDQRERMAGAMSFREDVEDVLGMAAAPPEPSGFLRALVETSAARADDLVAAVGEGDVDDDVVETVESYATSVRENATVVAESLEGAEFGTFDVVSAALDYNYGLKLYAARRLRNEHDDEWSEAALEAFDDLTTTLELFGPAREHFKTLYFQWELVNLSRAILYAAVPALAVCTTMILFFDPGAPVVAGETFGVGHAALVVALASTTAVFPFAILLSFIIRIATVTKRTLSIGPFVLRETDRRTDVEWDQDGGEEP